VEVPTFASGIPGFGFLGFSRSKSVTSASRRATTREVLSQSGSLRLFIVTFHTIETATLNGLGSAWTLFHPPVPFVYVVGLPRLARGRRAGEWAGCVVPGHRPTAEPLYGAYLLLDASSSDHLQLPQFTSSLNQKVDGAWSPLFFFFFSYFPGKTLQLSDL